MAIDSSLPHVAEHLTALCETLQQMAQHVQAQLDHYTPRGQLISRESIMTLTNQEVSLHDHYQRDVVRLLGALDLSEPK